MQKYNIFFIQQNNKVKRMKNKMLAEKTNVKINTSILIITQKSAKKHLSHNNNIISFKLHKIYFLLEK